jgi:hypothetical protein
MTDTDDLEAAWDERPRRGTPTGLDGIAAVAPYRAV